MKKVISAQTIKEAHRRGKAEIPAALGEFIITPEARSLAKELGVRIIDRESNRTHVNGSIDEQLIRTILEKVYMRMPDARRRPEAVKRAVIEVLSGYL